MNNTKTAPHTHGRRMASLGLVLALMLALFGALALALPLRARAAVETIQLDTLTGGESGNGWSYTAGSPNTLTISANGDGDGFLLSGSPASPIKIVVVTAGPVTLSSGGTALTNVYIEVTEDAATLTLANLTLTAPATMVYAHALNFTSASGSHILHFSGGVSLTGGANNTRIGYGIRSAAGLTITGGGAAHTLAATGGGPATGLSGGYGIWVNSGSLVLNGAGALTATGGAGDGTLDGALGIGIISGNMTMEAGSALRVAATGGAGGTTNGGGGNGLVVDGAMEVLGGSLEAFGGAGHGSRTGGHGIKCESALLAAPTEATGGTADGSAAAGDGVHITAAGGLTVEGTLAATGAATTGTGTGGYGISIDGTGGFTVAAGAVVNSTGGAAGTEGGSGVFMNSSAGNLILSGQLAATGGNSTTPQTTATAGAGMRLENTSTKVVFGASAARLTLTDGANAYKRPAHQAVPLQHAVAGYIWQVAPAAQLATGTPQDADIAVESTTGSATVVTLVSTGGGTPAPTPTPEPAPDPGPGSPQTGDGSNIPGWVGLGTAALIGLGLCGLVIYRRRRQRNKAS